MGSNGPQRNFDAICPLDHRYFDAEVSSLLSERAYIRALCMVEVASVKILASLGICPSGVVEAVEQAVALVTTEEVYREEEEVTGHDIRALVNRIVAKMQPDEGRWVHFLLTSFDVIDPARVWMYQQTFKELLWPRLLGLETTLMALSLRFAETTQMGRTHGQHAVPVTFGFAVALYVHRLGEAMLQLQERAGQLRGKMSGAVGAYNSSAIVLEDPIAFERDVLAELGLEPAEISTQIASPEPLIRFMQEMGIIGGIIGNLGRDMRNLMRTEINEVREALTASQVGSSTMAHKRNPINLENMESLWHVVVALSLLPALIQTSEHQRDLTNSAAARYLLMVPAILASSLKRAKRVMAKLEVDEEWLERNLALLGDGFLAEPYYLLLASAGHPDAHETVRVASRNRGEGSLLQAIGDDKEATRIMRDDQATADRMAFLAEDPSRYCGIAAAKTQEVVRHWAEMLGIPLDEIQALAAGQAG